MVPVTKYDAIDAINLTVYDEGKKASSYRNVGAFCLKLISFLSHALNNREVPKMPNNKPRKVDINKAKLKQMPKSYNF